MFTWHWNDIILSVYLLTDMHRKLIVALEIQIVLFS